jgi:thymidylate synthase
MNKYTHEDGTPFTKEEFLKKLETDAEFNKEFGNKGIDQISDLIKQLKENPDSRRLIVNAWAVNDLTEMTLPPCHYGFQVYTRPTTRDEKIVNPGKYRAISLIFNMRSIDTFLGLPFNIASYGLLLEIIAKIVNMVPDELIGNLGDTHLYLNHIEQAKEQIGKLSWEERREFLTEKQRDEFGNLSPFTEGIINWWMNCNNIPYSNRMPFELPKLVHCKTDVFYKSLSGDQSLYNHLNPDDFKLDNYKSHPAIKAPLSN